MLIFPASPIRSGKDRLRDFVLPFGHADADDVARVF